MWTIKLRSFKENADLLARIRAGPDARQEETQFIMKLCTKQKNGRNIFNPQSAAFKDFVERYEDARMEWLPFL
jgi:hypothetical protein